MKIVLIFPNPIHENMTSYRSPSMSSATLIKVFSRLFPSAKGTCFRMSKKHFLFPPLSLLSLAAVTPTCHDLSIIDERYQDINFSSDIDLVGITVSTKAAQHSYKIAKKFREQRVSVVLGGIHPSIMPQEASENADAIVIGEAEHVWERLLEDKSNGRLEKIYSSNTLMNMERFSYPQDREWSLLEKDAYVSRNIVQTSRGCPNRCKFCINSVDPIFGKTYRHRKIENVIEEIERQDTKELFFIDDNIVGDPYYSKELFKELESLKKIWGGFASLSIGKNPELIKGAAKCGCKMLIFGFESLEPKNLSKYGKKFNRNVDYKEFIRQIKREGILVFGNFIVGFDNDRYDTFDEIMSFVDNSDLDGVNVNVLTPYPATKIYQDLLRENRILDIEWMDYDSKSGKPCFELKNMSNKKFENVFVNRVLELYSRKRTLKRFFSANAPFIFRLLLVHYSLSKLKYYKKRVAEVVNLVPGTSSKYESGVILEHSNVYRNPF